MLSASYSASIIIGNVAVSILVDITQGPTYCPGFDRASPRLNYIVTCAWCNSFCILKALMDSFSNFLVLMLVWLVYGVPNDSMHGKCLMFPCTETLMAFPVDGWFVEAINKPEMIKIIRL